MRTKKEMNSSFKQSSPEKTPPLDLGLSPLIPSDRTSSEWAEAIIQTLVSHGIHQFCISPGSRSTPLTLAIAQNPKASVHLSVDERSSGFYALGYAKASAKPAVLVSTSGTAVANFYPAVIEASSDHIPMLLLTADRPFELQQTGANQSIQQHSIFGQYTRFHQSIPAPSSHVSLDALSSTFAQAVAKTLSPSAGPVHINCSFRKPLEPEYKATNPLQEESLIAQSQSKESPTRKPQKTHYFAPKNTLTEEQRSLLQKILSQSKQGLLVLGRMSCNTNKTEIHDLASYLQWPIVADIGSGFRFDAELKSQISIEKLLLLDPFSNAQPDCILHLGGPLVSNSYLQWLKHHPPQNYILAQTHNDREDPANLVTHRVTGSLEQIAKQLTVSNDSLTTKDSPHTKQKEQKDRDKWKHRWLQANHSVEHQIEHTLAQQKQITEPAVAREIIKQIPNTHGLFIGNSMPIRNMDRFAFFEKPRLKVAANRGASGIDGLLSSAIGFAHGLQSPITLLLGDLSLFHDLNSLALLAQSPQPIIVVLINNKGGGIFHFLPISKHQDVFEPYFTTPHDLNFTKIAQAFGIPSQQVKSLDDFRSLYQNAIQKNRSTLIEVQTDRENNFIFHQKCNQLIKQVKIS